MTTILKTILFSGLINYVQCRKLYVGLGSLFNRGPVPAVLPLATGAKSRCKSHSAHHIITGSGGSFYTGNGLQRRSPFGPRFFCQPI